MRRALFCCLLLSLAIAALTARAAEPPAVLKDVRRIVVLGGATWTGDFESECSDLIYDPVLTTLRH